MTSLYVSDLSNIMSSKVITGKMYQIRLKKYIDIDMVCPATTGLLPVDWWLRVLNPEH